MDDMQKREVIRFIEAIEDGTLNTADAYEIIREFEPILSYFLLKYLREKHPVTDRDSGAGSRLLSLVSTYSDMQAILKRPPNDPMVEWFEDTHSYREFFKDKQAYVDVLIDKLEG